MRCDNGTEFKNSYIIELYGSKGIKREYSNARTPQQNRVAERKNRTLIKAARTKLAHSKLPTMFWIKAVRTACYVLNRVLVTNPHNKTPYALLTGNIPSVSHFKLFGCHVTILNTSDHLGKFDGKANEGYIVGYSTSNKAYKVYNVPNKRVEETMNLTYLEEKPNVHGLGHEWYFDLDYLTDTLSYKHVQANQSTGTQEASTNLTGTQDVDSDSDCDKQVIIVPSYPSHSIQGTEPKDTSGDEVDDSPLNSTDRFFQKELARLKGQEQRATSDAERLGLGFANDAEVLQKRASRKTVPLGSIPVPTRSIPVPSGDTMVSTDDVPVHTIVQLTHFLTMSLQQDSPVHQTLEIMIPHMVLVDLPEGKYAIGTKWILKNKRDARGIVVRNKARLVAQPLPLTWDLWFIRWMLRVRFFMEELMMRYMSLKLRVLWILNIPRRPKRSSKLYMDFIKHQELGLQVQQRPDGMFISQDKYVQEILNKFDLGSVKTATTPYEAPKPKSKNKSDSPINNQVTPTTLDLEAVKKIFKYLKGQPKLGLWYPRESPFVLKAYSDCDYAGANKDRKSTTGGCQFLGRRLISWQCNKQTIMATSSTEAEYVAAANCYVSTLNCDQLPAQNLNPSSTSSMAALRYKDGHNKVGYLLKSTGSDNYHQIIEFLKASHIRSPELGPPAIQATIDKTPYTITEDLVRSQFQLADDGGIDDLPIVEIYAGMDNLGPLAIAIICLFDGRQFNWSSYIFKGMAINIGNAKKILMYLRFLQAILGIETRIKRQYKVLKFSSKLFANMRLNFEGHPMPLLAAMLSQDQKGKGAGVATQAVPQHMPVPDQPQDHLSTPPRQQTSDPNALVFEHGQSSDPNIASFSQTHETGADPFANVEDEPLEALSICLHQGPLKLPLQKVYSLETELKDHKKLFKDVVGKLVKKVKPMEVKLQTMKKKMVVSDSNQEEGGKQDVDLDALIALANAAVTVDLNIPHGGASDTPAASTSVPADVPTSAYVPTGSTSVPVDVPPSAAPADVSNKGKTPMVEEDITVKERKFKQMQDDRLGEQAAKRLHDEEQAQVDRQRAELQRRRQQETLLGDDVFEDNFLARMAALIKRKMQALAKKLAKERRNRPMTQGQQRTYMRQFVKNQSSAVYSTGWSMAYVKSFTDDQLKEEFEKIRKVLFDSHEGGKGSFVWQNQHLWQIRSWRLYTLSNVYVLETVSREVVYMFADVSYPFSIKLMERMLKHKLEIDKDGVGNDMTTAEQLIQVFNSPMLHLLRVEMVINSPWIMPILGTKELASPEQTALDAVYSRDILRICADFSSILVKTQSLRYVVLTGRVVVPAGRYVVSAVNIIIVSSGRLSLIPTGRVLTPGRIQIAIPR
uniref:Ribonuclease H-like domain-containing protein n=1 Tax=Tanacetum cinerariifolium TaxID=118510 RepID=A0A6L2LVA7_TANCI|nr:ribonuclease H-like domain-containing protein [Tanacetum cinerariifolium]